MTALTMSLSQPVRAAASAAVAATVPAPASTSSEVSEVRYTQVSPASALNVAPETVAAIQQLGSAKVPEQGQAADVRSFQEFQAEARRWERYYAHQPRRLEDLIAVYYGGLPGSRNASIDPRGPYPKDVVREVETSGKPSGASEDEDRG
jgi:hypothetical protein